MKPASIVSSLFAVAIFCAIAHPGLSRAADYSVQYVPLKDVQVNDAFWTPRLETNRVATIPHLLRMNDEHDRLNNLKKGAGLMPGPYVSRRYNDTDVYKLLEAIGYSLVTHPDPALEKIADEQIDIIAKAQQPDGYIYPARTIDPKNPAPGAGTERWSREGGSHELFNQGHFIEAGIAYSQATGNPKFLNMAVKCGDMLCDTFGPDKRHDTSGHEEVELALVKLTEATGKAKYADLARFFIDQRGLKHTFGDYSNDAPVGFLMYNDRAYRQDDKPVIEQSEAEGHAVRAAYLYCGLTDVAALTRREDYTDATVRLWEDVIHRKMYITGGIGSTGGTEAFGADFVLPNAAYTETCAAIGNALWNDRLFRLEKQGRYLDMMERIVYDGVITGVSLKGDRFFYQNPLQAGASRGRRGRPAGGEGDDTGISSASEGPRQPWFDVACCPANLARFVAQFPEYIYAADGNTLFVNFFVGSDVTVNLKGNRVHVRQETKYPWDGEVKLTLEPEKDGEFTVNLRLPGWSQNSAWPSDLYHYVFDFSQFDFGAESAPKWFTTLKVNGEDQSGSNWNHGFLVFKRKWKKGDTIEVNFKLPVRRVIANENVAADKGRVAVERGPMLYCAEGVDNDGKVLDREVPGDATLTEEFRPDLLGGVTVIKGKWADGTDMTLVPYCTWGNRGNGEMAVWLKTKQ